MRTPNWHHLHIFLKVAHHLSFSEAAKEIGLGVSTVWELVAQFEKQTGPLIHRERCKAIKLTPLGQSLASELTPLFNALEKHAALTIPMNTVTCDDSKRRRG
jgi:DNA-binding transcriptional LysR family regulator